MASQDGELSIKSFDSEAPAFASPPAKRMKYTKKPSLQPTMQIFVRNLVGKVFAFDGSPEAKVEHVKNRIEEAQGVPPVVQRLIFARKQLYDSTTLEAVSTVPHT